VNEEILRGAKATVKGGAILTTGQILSTLISFVTLIFVIRLLGEELYGVYGLVLVPISMATLFCGWGVPLGLTRYIAWLRAKNRVYEVRKFIVSATIFVFTVNIILTIVIYVSAKPIATFYQKPEIAPLIRIASLALLVTGIYRVAWNMFLGFEDTKYNAAMLVTNAVIKGFLALALVLMGYGVLGAILGYVMGYFGSTLLGAVLIPREIIKYERSSTTFQVLNRTRLKDALSLLLSFGLPLAIINIVTGFGKQFYNFLAGKYCSKWDFGNYNAATTLLIPLPVLATPISTVMFPAYSKIDGTKEKKLLDSAFKLAVKYVSLLIVPVAALVIGLSEPLKTLIFGDSFPNASFYLMLLAIVYLYTPLGYINFGPLLKGQGYTKIVMISGLIGLAAGIPTSFLLIPMFGIVGLIFTNIVVTTVTVTFNLLIIKKKLRIDIHWSSSIKILLAGIITIFSVHFLQMWINAHAIFKFIIGSIVGLTIYITIVLISGAITMEDIYNLKVIFRGIRPIRRVLKPHAKKIEEILRKILE